MLKPYQAYAIARHKPFAAQTRRPGPRFPGLFRNKTPREIFPWIATKDTEATVNTMLLFRMKSWCTGYLYAKFWLFLITQRPCWRCT